MLEDLASLLTTAERLADRVADLCRRGEPVDNELDGLSRAVAAVVAALSDGVPPPLHRRWHALTNRVAAATAAVEARKVAVVSELERLARHARVSRAYARPPA